MTTQYYEQAHFYGIWFEDQGGGSGYDVLFNLASTISFNKCRFNAETTPFQYGGTNQVNYLSVVDCLGNPLTINGNANYFYGRNYTGGFINSSTTAVILNDTQNPWPDGYYAGIQTSNLILNSVYESTGPNYPVGTIAAPYEAGSSQINTAPVGTNVTRGWFNVQTGISAFGWQPSYGYGTGSIVIPVGLATNGHAYQAQNAGTSGSGLGPSWPTGSGSTVNDNGIIWKEVGSSAYWNLFEDTTFEYSGGGWPTSEQITRVNTASYSSTSAQILQAVLMRPGLNSLEVKVSAVGNDGYYASWWLALDFYCVANASSAHPNGLTITTVGTTNTIDSRGSNGGALPVGWSTTLGSNLDGQATITIQRSDTTTTTRWTAYTKRILRS